MRIVHLALSGPFTEGFTYHENLLPLFQCRLGHNVSIIARSQQYCGAKIVSTDVFSKKIEDGTIDLYRVEIKQKRINSFTNPRKKDVFNILDSIRPDVIWTHSLMNSSLKLCVEYKKQHQNIIICADNHIDFGNYKKSLLRYVNLLHFKLRNLFLRKKVDLFYGVTPGRVDFMKKYLGAPSDTKLTIMGADETKICFKQKNDIRRSFRHKYQIPDDAFVFVTGGKLTKDKKIIELINCFLSSASKNTYLVIFGSLSDDLFDDFKNISTKSNKVIFVGWADEKQIYDILLSSDFAIFLGGHSTLWESVKSCGLPSLFGKKNGFEHLYDGSSMFFSGDFQSLVDFLDFIPNSERFDKMKRIAENNKSQYFYSTIAEKTIFDMEKVKEKNENKGCK